MWIERRKFFSNAKTVIVTYTHTDNYNNHPDDST